MLVLDPRSKKLTGFARLFFQLCPISRVAGHLTGFFLSLVYLLFFRIIKALFTCVYHLHIWQVSPQLSCSDTCQIWLWFNRSIKYYDKSQFLKWRKLTGFFWYSPPQLHIPMQATLEWFSQHESISGPVAANIACSQVYGYYLSQLATKCQRSCIWIQKCRWRNERT